MARAKNFEMREKIYREALRLFSEKGYYATSFANIAEACGVERTVIQYYFPYKDYFIQELVEDCLQHIDEMALLLDEERFDVYGRLYYAGYLFFDFLLNSPRMKNLTEDILGQRTLVNAIIPLHCQQDKLYTKGEFDEDATIMSMGGTYELMYYRLKNHIPITSRYLVDKSFLVFAGMHGLGAGEIQEKIGQYNLEEKDIEADRGKLEEYLFQ